MPKQAGDKPAEPTQDPGRDWAAWLQTQLDARGWRPADLVRAAGTHDHGQPIVRSERLTKWLKAGQRPSYDLAIVVAATLGAPPIEALRVAGYDTVPPAIQNALQHLADHPPTADLSDRPTAELIAELYRRFVDQPAGAGLRIAASDGRAWGDLTPKEQAKVRKAITDAGYAGDVQDE